MLLRKEGTEQEFDRKQKGNSAYDFASNKGLSSSNIIIIIIIIIIITINKN